MNGKRREPRNRLFFLRFKKIGKLFRFEIAKFDEDDTQQPAALFLNLERVAELFSRNHPLLEKDFTYPL